MSRMIIISIIATIASFTIVIANLVINIFGSNNQQQSTDSALSSGLGILEISLLTCFILQTFYPETVPVIMQSVAQWLVR